MQTQNLRCRQTLPLLSMRYLRPRVLFWEFMLWD
jgi:hypothetical protein